MSLLLIETINIYNIRIKSKLIFCAKTMKRKIEDISNGKEQAADSNGSLIYGPEAKKRKLEI